MNTVDKVLIFTSTLCGYCYKAKSLLKRKNIPYNEINIDIDYEKREEMINKSKGKTSVPQIFFGDLYIGGYDELYKLEQENGLEFLNK
tara:strand:- start:48 stop:311 length:264 start_codon:yes stop_codon:yes gene_type:complete